MTRSARLKASLMAAMVFSFTGGSLSAKIPARENLFCPSQAICTETAAEVGEPLTVVKDSGDIQISFKIAELIRDMLKQYK